MKEHLETDDFLEDQFYGILLGTAVGDALGLPAEGLCPIKIQKRWGNEWRMSLVLGRGMVSDDTEHSLMVAQTLLSCCDDVQKFRQRLAGKLRWWILALPAGVGLATAKACIKLWLGVSTNHSGVHSAGNGPSMRVAIIGAFFARNSEKREEFVRTATRITHRSTSRDRSPSRGRNSSLVYSRR